MDPKITVVIVQNTSNDRRKGEYTQANLLIGDFVFKQVFLSALEVQFLELKGVKIEKGGNT